MLLRKADGSVEAVHDRHTFGVFSRDVWLRAFRQRGLWHAKRAQRSLAARRFIARKE